MKILVVFGSASDENVAKPLVEALKADFETEYAVISAHRDLEKLQHKINDWEGDAIVAGAGLAAALPGVVAAMTKIPVFGVPVASQFGGLDSFASIAQMPPGVPVMTCAPGKTSEIVSFLKVYAAAGQKQFTRIHFVMPDRALLNHPELIAAIDKAKAVAGDKGAAITLGEERASDGFNIYLAAAADHVSKGFGLHVPFFMQNQLNAPSSYLSALEWAEQGGLWVGANNTRNAVHSVLRLGGAARLLQGKAA